MPAETIGFAILGTGMVARYHQQAIAANAERGARLIAVGHYDASRFAEIGARFGVPCLALEDLLKHPEVDVICICTPSGQHAAQAMAAARAGKHVLVEKPMAVTLSEAEEMITTCASTGVRLGVVLQRRAEPLFQRIKTAIQQGALGTLTLGCVTIPYFRPQAYYDQADWRGTWALDGGGVLMNQGIHLVDLLLWYMGDPVQVQASADTLQRDIAVEDTLVATLRFASGALATITATTTAAPGFPHRIEIYGTEGGIQVEGESLVRWESTRSSRPAGERTTGGTPVSAGAGADPRGIAPTGHIAIVRDFIQALRTARPPFIDGREGCRSLRTILQIYQAAGLPSPQRRA